MSCSSPSVGKQAVQQVSQFSVPGLCLHPQREPGANLGGRKVRRNAKLKPLEAQCC